MALGREGGFAHRPLIFFCSSLLKALNLVRHIDYYHYITAYISRNVWAMTDSQLKPQRKISHLTGRPVRLKASGTCP